MRTNKLLLKYIELSNLKGSVLENIKDLSTEELSWAPTNDKWCISQVVEHIIESESGTNKYINKKIAVIEEQPKVGFINSVYSGVLNRNLKSDKKFKTPKVLPEPKAGSSFIELKEKWDNSRLYLIKTIENYPPKKMNTAIFRHPKAGLLNLSQTLSFMINHLKHHIPQIDALRFSLEEKNKKAV